MDAIATISLTTSIIFSIIVKLGFDPIWFGIAIASTAEWADASTGRDERVRDQERCEMLSFATILMGVWSCVSTGPIRLMILIAFPVDKRFARCEMRALVRRSTGMIEI